MNFNLDIVIFIGFLALNLYVGLNYGKGVKNIKDYALGGRNFSTGALVATIVATYVSGSGFFTILSKTYSDGLYFVIASSGLTLSFLVAAFVFIPKMGEFLGSTSVAEAMGNLYGKEVRFIVAIAGLIGSMGSIAVQFKAFGNIFDYFLNFPSGMAVIVAGIIVTIYSAFGGIRSVTFTDILQFFTFGFAIPLIGILIWNQVNDSGANISLLNTLNDPKFNIKKVFDFNNPRFWEMIPLVFYFAIPHLKPAFYQRIAIGKNIAQVKKAFIISAALVLVIELAISWIPFLIYSINPNLQSGKILGFIIDNYTFSGLKGLLMVGVTAMAMSTADSYINASAVLFANDIYLPLKKKDSRELLISRTFSCLLGVFSITLALTAKDLLDIILFANAFYVPIVTVPLMVTIIGFRSSTKSILIAMAAGFITVIAWKIIGIKADCIAFSMIINLIFLISSHYILKQPGGWIKVREEDAKKEFVDAQANSTNKFFAKLNHNIANFNLIEFFKKHSPKDELTYMSFGIYCIGYTFATMYSTQAKLFNSDSKTLLHIYQVMLCTSVCMAMYPIWPPRVKHEIIVQVAWNFVLFYMLVFFSGFFVLISNFYPLQFVVFTINIIVVALLSSWRTALLMMIPGFYLSTKFYKYYSGITDGLNVSLGDPQYIMMYGLIILGAIFVIFLRPKEYERILAQEKAEHLASTMDYKDGELHKALKLKNEFIRNVTHEYHAPMTGVIDTAEALLSGYQFLDDERKIKAIETIYQSAVRLESFDANIKDLARLSSNEAELIINRVNLSDLVNQRLEVCRKLYVDNAKQTSYSFITNIEDNVLIDCDEYYVTQTLDNLIINALTYCKQGNIKIELIKKNNNVSFSITDEGIGIPKEEIYDIFGEFTVSSKTRTPAGGRGVGLALCKKVLEMHKGIIKADSKEGKTTFTFSLPLVFDDLAKPVGKETIKVIQNLLKNGVDVKLISKSMGIRESQIKAMQK